jgi:hypothetical protein
MNFTSDFELGEHVIVRHQTEYTKTNPEGFIITRISVDCDAEGSRFHYYEDHGDGSGTGWDSASLERVHSKRCSLCGDCK